MFSTKKYLPIFAAFAIGMIGAGGYAVHAASVAPSTTIASPVQTTAQDPNNLDGETADDTNATVQTSAQDPQQLDGETNDDGQVQQGSVHEAESGPGDTGTDTGEADTGN